MFQIDASDLSGEAISRHRDAARRCSALAIGSGNIGTYRILSAYAAEHEARATEIEVVLRERRLQVQFD